MKGSTKQIAWAEELKAQAMTVLKWARDNYPADHKGGNEQLWKENMTGLMMCLDRVACASDIIDALKTGKPYACTLDDMSRIAAAININLIRGKVITAPTQDEIRAELAAEETAPAAEEPAPVEIEEESEQAAPTGETKEAAPTAGTIRELCGDRHTIRPNILLHDLGGDVNAIFARWQERYDKHPDPQTAEEYDAERLDVNAHLLSAQMDQWMSDPDIICAAAAADGAYYDIIREITRLYFSRFSRADAEVILLALGTSGSIDLIPDNPDLHFSASDFRREWNALHPDSKLF